MTYLKLIQTLLGVDQGVFVNQNVKTETFEIYIL